MDGSPAAAAPQPPGPPLWVKVLGTAALLAILGFVVFHLTGSAPTGH